MVEVRRLGISSFLALLMIIVITIGVFIAVSGFLSGWFTKQAPKGGELVLAGFTWLYQSTENGRLIISVRGVLTNVDNEPINVTAAYLVIGDNEYPLQFYEIKDLEPNDVREFVGRTTISDLPELNVLTVMVEYCTP